MQLLMLRLLEEMLTTFSACDVEILELAEKLHNRIGATIPSTRP